MEDLRLLLEQINTDLDNLAKLIADKIDLESRLAKKEFNQEIIKKIGSNLEDLENLIEKIDEIN